jgi:catechol 2,3-dioxygenase-like lactoylglutathione lyase family enzyme
VNFYTKALGLRLVKQTVNFDAPDTYHLYYGDQKGSPSSLLTFFPWPGVQQGRQGAGHDYGHGIQRVRLDNRLVAGAVQEAGC